MKSFGKISLFLIIAFSVISCHKVFFTGGSKNNIKPVKLYQKIIENELSYNTFLLKADGEISVSENKQSFQINIRIKNDSIIWASLRTMGIEGMRVKFTPDSVYMIDRINNKWFGGNYKELNEMFDIDFDYFTIQSIMTNTFFFYPNAEDTEKTLHDFSQCRDTLNYCISSIKQRKYEKLFSDTSENRRLERRLNRETDNIGEYENSDEHNDFVIQTIKVYPEIYKISYQYLSNFISKQAISIYYNKPQLFETNYFPSEIIIEYYSEKFEFSLNMLTERIEVNIDQKYPFKIPDDFERIKYKY